MRKIVKTSIMIWANIRKIQIAFEMSDGALASVLGVSISTLYNYDKEPERLTMRKIEAFMEWAEVDFQYMIQ